jgi:hypothetical protein
MHIELSERRQRHVAGVLFVALGLLLLASLVTYRAPLAGESLWATPNASGPLGAGAARLLTAVLGRIAAFGVPLLALAWGVNRLRARPAAPLALETAFGILIVVETLGLVGLFGPATRPWVGAVGAGLASFAVGVLGPVGGAIALVALFLVSGLVASEIGFGLVTTAFRLFLKAPARAVLDGAKERHAQAKARAAAGMADPVIETSTAIEPARRRRPREAVAEAPALAPEDAVPVAPRIVTARPVTEGDALAAARREEAELREARVREKETKALERAAARQRTSGEIPMASEMAEAAVRDTLDAEAHGEPPPGAAKPGRRRTRPDRAWPASRHRGRRARDGRAALVKQPEIPRVPSARRPARPRAARGRARAVPVGERGRADGRGATADGEDARLRHHRPVTEVPRAGGDDVRVRAGAGVKVSQITSREDDLALAMRARQIRILAPIPARPPSASRSRTRSRVRCT